MCCFDSLVNARLFESQIMKQTLTAFILSIGIVISAGVLVAPHNQVAASGATSTRNQPGDTVIRDENGVVYLTTEAVPGEATRSSRVRILGTPISLPRGFAADIASLLNAVLSFVMVISALLVLMYLIWGAFGWLTSGGDKGKIDAARQKMMAAVVGLIIVSASYAILLLAIRFLGFENLADVFNSVKTIDGSGTGIEFVEASPSPSPSPSPSNYSDNLGELMDR
jgi:hypothetical protein